MDDSGSLALQIINECQDDEPEEQTALKFKDNYTEAGDIFLMDFPSTQKVEEPNNKLLPQQMDLKMTMKDSNMLLNFTEGKYNLPKEQLEHEEVEGNKLKGSLNKISPIFSKAEDIKLLDEPFLTPLESHGHSFQPTYCFQTKGIKHSEYPFKSPPKSREQLFQSSVSSQIEGTKYDENSFTRELHPHGHFFHPSPKDQPIIPSSAHQQNKIINSNFSGADKSTVSFLDQMLKEKFSGKQNSYAMQSSSIINITDKENNFMDNRMNIKLYRESFETLLNFIEDNENPFVKKLVVQETKNMVFKKSSNRNFPAIEEAKEVRKLDSCLLSPELRSTPVTPLAVSTAEYYRENISNPHSANWEDKFEESQALKVTTSNSDENCLNDESSLPGLSNSNAFNKNLLFQNAFRKRSSKTTAIASDEKAQIQNKTNFTAKFPVHPDENFQHNSSRNHNGEFEGSGLFEPNIALENMIEKTLRKNSPENNVSPNFSSPTDGKAKTEDIHPSLTDENDISNSIIIEIYRKIVRIFEIICIIPLAVSIENCLDLIELVSASAFSMVHYFFTKTTPITEGNLGSNSDLDLRRNSTSHHLEQTRNLVCTNIDYQSEETNGRYIKGKICRSSTSLKSFCNDHNYIRNEVITSQLVISQNNEDFGGDSDRKLDKAHFPSFQRELPSMMLSSEGFDQRLVPKSSESNLIDFKKDLSDVNKVFPKNSFFKTVDEIFRNNDVNDKETCLEPFRESTGFDECLETVDTFDSKSVFSQEDSDETSSEKGFELYDNDLVFKLKDLYIRDEERDPSKTYPDSTVSCKNKNCDICFVQENGSNVFMQFGDELGIGFLNGRELKLKSNSIEVNNNSVGINSDTTKATSDSTTSKIKKVETSSHSDLINKCSTKNLEDKHFIPSENDILLFSDTDSIKSYKEENLIEIVHEDQTCDQFQIHEIDFDTGNIDTYTHSGDQFLCNTLNRNILSPAKMQIAKITEILLKEIGNDCISDGLFINESAFRAALESRKLEEEEDPETKDEMSDILSSAEPLLDSSSLPAIKQSDPCNIEDRNAGTNKNLPTVDPELNVVDKSDNLKNYNNETFQVLNHSEEGKMEKSEDNLEGIEQSDSCKIEERSIKANEILPTLDHELNVVEESDDLKISNQEILQVLNHLEEVKMEKSEDNSEGIQESDSYKTVERNIKGNEILPTLDHELNVVEESDDLKISNQEILQVLNHLGEGKMEESGDNQEGIEQSDSYKIEEKINKTNEILPTLVHELNVKEESKDLKISNCELLQHLNDSEGSKIEASDYNPIVLLSDQCQGSNFIKVREFSTSDNKMLPPLEQSRIPKMEESKDGLFEIPSIQDEICNLADENNDLVTSDSKIINLSKLSGTLKMEDSKVDSVEMLSVQDERCNLADENNDSVTSGNKRLPIFKQSETPKMEDSKDDSAAVLLLSDPEERCHLAHESNDFETSDNKVFPLLKGSGTPKMKESKDNSIEIPPFQDENCNLADENIDFLFSDNEVLSILKQLETFNMEESKYGSFEIPPFQDNKCNITDESNDDVTSENEVLPMLKQLGTSKMEESKLDSDEIFLFQNDKCNLSDENIDSTISDNKSLIDSYSNETSSKDKTENVDIKALLDFLIREVENSLNKEIFQIVESSENTENLYLENYSLLNTVKETDIMADINNSMLTDPIESGRNKIVISEKSSEVDCVSSDIDQDVAKIYSDEFKLVETTQETDKSSERYSSDFKDDTLSNDLNYDQNRMLDASEENVAFEDSEENESLEDLSSNYAVLDSTEEIENIDERKEPCFANNESYTDFDCATLRASEDLENSRCGVMNVSLEVNCSLNSLESLSSEDDEDATDLHEIQDIDGNVLKISPSLQGYRSLKESENYSIDNYGRHIETQNTFSTGEEYFLESDGIQVKSSTDIENSTDEEIYNIAFNVPQFKASEEEHSHFLTSTPVTSSSYGFREDELLSSEPFEPTSSSNNMFDANLKQSEELENEDTRKKRHGFLKHRFSSVWKKIHKQCSSVTIEKAQKYKKHQNDS
ncbi:hypothetical protein AVEN_99077-1 [Araneus ventricosus]|uniref:Uncharacterized protein n=1 Tax=Araneus ventricosus TaxID=182803 RepID=A0A4Y2JUU9_ARAVE|nr:hypothetical protein AVEN_99077-1 [Araneus ventricosus]